MPGVMASSFIRTAIAFSMALVIVAAEGTIATSPKDFAPYGPLRILCLQYNMVMLSWAGFIQSFPSGREW